MVKTIIGTKYFLHSHKYRITHSNVLI